MVKTTRKQREALHNLWARKDKLRPGETYRQFRKRVFPEFCGWGAVMIEWSGMTIGIEKDGYAHS